MSKFMSDILKVSRLIVPAVLLLIIVTMEGQLFAVTDCWVSPFPPLDYHVTHVPASTGVGNATYWVGTSGVVGTAKVSIKLPQNGFLQEKKILSIITPEVGVATAGVPFAIPYDDSKGEALLVVKDDVSKCAYPFVIGGLVVESENTKPILDASGVFPSCTPAITESLIDLTGAVLPSISKVSVTLSLDHTFDGDLIVNLVSPQGTVVRVFTNIGGAGDNFGYSTYRRTMLDDEATTPIGSAGPPFFGMFLPENALSNVNGEDPNGVWALQIIDSACGDSGYIKAWSLTLY